MRELGRFRIELGNTNASVANLFCALKPENNDDTVFEIKSKRTMYCNDNAIHWVAECSQIGPSVVIRA